MVYKNNKLNIAGGSDTRFVEDLRRCQQILQRSWISEAEDIFEQWGCDGELFQNLSAEMLIPCLWGKQQVLNPNLNGSEIIVHRATIVSQRKRLAMCFEDIIPFLATRPFGKKQKVRTLKTIIKTSVALREIYQ